MSEPVRAGEVVAGICRELRHDAETCEGLTMGDIAEDLRTAAALIGLLASALDGDWLARKLTLAALAKELPT